MDDLGHYCNPLDLAYRYQDLRFKGVVQGVVFGEPRRSVHREGADPSVVRFRNRFYLFASMSRGFWHSADLVDWEYRASEALPAYDYAPDARVIDGALIVCASKKDAPCPFFRSEDPLTGDFTEVAPGTFPFWDPNLFQDEDGKVFLYWGCSSTVPVRGVQVDPESFTPLGEPVDLVAADTTARGWERTGEDHVKAVPRTELERKIAQFQSGEPYIEGAWMTRRGDTYYLQYAAPGTQWNTYADGYFTSPSPLGPFAYSPHSPFSSKPGGFATGAGHGSTFQDAHGNWWHAATMRISVNDPFERRVGIFPAGFDADGVLFCNQHFGDYPRPVPAGSADPWADPPWMLLSYRAEATASSSLAGHGPALAADEDIRTWWAAGSREPGEWVSLDLGATQRVHAIQVNLAAHGVDAPECPDGVDVGHSWRGVFAEHQAAEFLVEVSADGAAWEAVRDTRGTGEDGPHALVVLEGGRQVRHVRVTAGRQPFDAVFAVSGLRVFGIGGGPAPEPVAVTAVRTDDLTARLDWPESPGADGYNVRYGAHPEKLYQSRLVHGRNELELRTLNADTDYWVAVDAFNGGGIAPGTTVRVVTNGPQPENVVAID
ncbi:family 43 glycosylhydrolase [Glycomyces artemisiae]|uniref:Glycosyl hydrolase family 43 n=1 Tax=Glycomyces artemisiae TaxID=1076443 RepID=A0A2T0UGT7_9ACTN|nr:family 43 glycosylhydrolase [Glycomyces artemisiae]PRY57160.1 glycosyl hydrolase family 43 [Glycomyces artemisiae]